MATQTPATGDHLEAARVPAQDPYRELAQLAPEAIFIANTEGRFTEVNAAACALLGYPREQLIGRSIVELILPSEVPRMADVRDVLLGGGASLAEWQLRHLDGTYIPVELSAKILADGRWIAFARDLRHRKLMEEALRLSEQRFRVALEGAPIALFNQDLDMRYTWSYNPPPPLQAHEIVGKLQQDITPGPLAEQLVAFKRKVIQTGLGARKLVAMEYPDGQHWFDITIEPRRDDTGRIVGITGASWDVTERKRNEDEQRLLGDASTLLGGLSTDWVELLSTIAPLALRLPADFCVTDVIDDDGQARRLDIIHVDPAMAGVCAQLTALPIDRGRPNLAQTVLRTRQPRLISDVTPAFLASVTQSPEHLRLAEQLHMRSLIEVPLLSRGRLLGMFMIGSSTRRFGANDLRIAMALGSRVAIAIDNARLHRSLQRALDARDKVLAMVVHDLRNPLNSVLLQSEILANTLDDTSDIHTVERIRHAVRRMNRLVQDLVDVVRLDAREPLLLDIEAVPPGLTAKEALDAMEPLAEVGLVELRLECESDLPPVRADHDRVMQIFENLVGNAIKFSPRGARVLVRVARHGDRVRFSVTDSGPGIHAEHLSRLFDRHWQERRGDRRGLGLGLYVVKGIVDEHGGRIWVESEPGHGSTFHVELDVMPPPAPELDPDD